MQNVAAMLETRSEVVALAIVVGVIGAVVFWLNERAQSWPEETTAEGRKRLFTLHGPR